MISAKRVRVLSGTCAMTGRVVLAPVKPLWLGLQLALSGVAVIWFAAPGAMAASVVLTVVTICAGHSVGMHRLLIHRSFATYHPVELLLVWLGTLVGMAGPMGMIRAHDMRDWYQRQEVCPPHPSHEAGFWRDAWWQVCCAYRLDHPPDVVIEPEVARSRAYCLMERLWTAQQVPVALVLYGLGGLSWVLWGISVRISVSLIGHWLVGRYAHRGGHQGWRVRGVSVQGQNLPRLGLVTFGENWHGNHHAFPHSAQLGIEPGQADPGYALIRALERLGLVWDVCVPGSEPPRAGLVRV